MPPLGPTTGVAVGRLLLLGGFAGLAAAAVMDLPMRAQPEGFTPAFVAASALRRVRPTAVVFRDAVLVHHAAGTLAGVLYGALLYGLSSVPSGPVVAGVGLVPHLLAVLAVTLFVYSAFAYVVLPRAGGTVYEDRATAVRGQWLRSSAVFGLSMLVLGPLLLGTF